MAHDADDVLHIVDGDHLATAVQTLREELRDARFDVGHDLLPTVRARELGADGVQVAVQAIIGVLLDVEHRSADVGCEGLFHRCTFFRVVFLTAWLSSSQVWSSSLRNLSPTVVSL